MENAIYGGRVDNSYDFNVLKTYLKQYMNSSVLAGEGRNKAAERGLKLASPTVNRQDYIRLIDSLPDADTPHLFGLPSNVERSVQRSQSAQVIKQLKKLARSMAMYSSNSSGTKFNREHWRAELGPIIELWDRLTKSDRSVLSRAPGADQSVEEVMPLSQFVRMESIFASDIIQLVDQHMKAIKRVVYGSGLLTPQIQVNGSALMAGRVPMAWEKKWEGPENPQAWLKAVVLKKIALDKWSTKMDSLKSAGSRVHLDLSELFNPGTFLMALRQQTSRIGRLPMDDLALSSSFGDELDRAPLPVSITGLLMQGATFEEGRLALAGDGAPELCTMNACTLAFTPTSNAHKKTDKGKLDVPLYFSPTREKLLTPISISVQSQAEDWIIAGVALFLSSD